MVSFLNSLGFCVDDLVGQHVYNMDVRFILFNVFSMCWHLAIAANADDRIAGCSTAPLAEVHVVILICIYIKMLSPSMDLRSNDRGRHKTVSAEHSRDPTPVLRPTPCSG